MADNVPITAGAGIDIATDEVGGVHLQRFKVTPGGDGRAAYALSRHRDICDATTNATSVKASAGELYAWYFTNSGSAWRYLKLYDKASAPTVGTDTPILTLGIPPGGGANCELFYGVSFTLGIAYAVTTGAADSDTTAPGANEVILHLFYV